jgi:dTMP kinase
LSLFITFEGPDGSGKSTQCKLLAEHLTSIGYNVLCTREPGGTDISLQVRQILMDMKNKSMFPATEFLLFSSARAQLVREVIKPHLAQEKGIVIADRFFDSSFAYQGYGHGIPLETIRTITEFATDGLKPDLTLLLDIDAEQGLRRRQKPGTEWNRLDDYDLALHKRVREGFLTMAAAEPNRWVTLDADQDPDKLQQSIRRVVRKSLEGL